MASTSNQIVALGVERVWKKTTGRGVRVAILDTGVFTSSALPAKRVTSIRANGGPPAPSTDSHGTSCASLVGSEATDAEGLAPECALLSVQVGTGPDTISAAQVALGLEQALIQGCDVISCSFTLERWSGKMDEIAALVRQAHMSGVPVLVAQGNQPGNPAVFPEEVQHAIAVSSHTVNWRPSAVNRNEWSDVFSLGEKLTVVNGAGNARDWRGQTSGATAIVAGAVALALASVPKSKRVDVGRAMDGLLKFSGDEIGTSATGTPWLALNAGKLVEAARNL